MFCTNCGKQHPDNISFCPYCGAKVVNVAMGSASTPAYSSPMYSPIQPVKKSKKGPLIAIIILIAALIISAILVAVFLFGRRNNPVAEYLNSSDFKELYEIESKMLSSYGSVTGDNYVSDEQTLTELSEHTITYARELYDKSLEVAQKLKEDRKSTRLNSSHPTTSRMPSSA